MPSVEEIWPPFGVTVRADDLEMRAVREADLPEFVELVRGGIHAADAMPFSFAWTEVPAAEAPANFARWLFSRYANFTAEDFDLSFAVRVRGELVGVQALTAQKFPVLRTAETGSWLGLPHHGRGIGTRMRQAVCAFAFDELGAAEVTSVAYQDNPASLAVSRKVGYQRNGTQRALQRDQPATQQRFVLTAQTFRRGAPTQVSGAARLRTFLHLDDAS